MMRNLHDFSVGKFWVFLTEILRKLCNTKKTILNQSIISFSYRKILLLHFILSRSGGFVLDRISVCWSRSMK